MADERPAVAPEWATTAAPGDRVSAPGDKINSGWAAGEAPPHNWINFLFKNPADWVRYLDTVTSAMASLNWEQAVGEGTDGVFTNGTPTGGDYDPLSGYWVLAGLTDGCWISTDDARTFVDFGTGMASTVSLRDCAIGATSSAVCVGNSATAYRRDTILSGSWGTVTLPGSPTSLRNVLYDTQNTRYIVLGSKSGEPYAATSDNDTGTAFTERSDNLPAVFDGEEIVSAAVNNAGIVVASVLSAATKTAFSTDGGIAWSESTTALVSGKYDIAWSAELDLFVAVRKDSTTTNQTYTSSDGDVWTPVGTGPIGFDNDILSSGHSVRFLRHALVVGGRRDSLAVLGISEDLGATWSIQQLDSLGGVDPNMATSRSGGKLVAVTDSGFGYRSARSKAG